MYKCGNVTSCWLFNVTSQGFFLPSSSSLALIYSLEDWLHLLRGCQVISWRTDYLWWCQVIPWRTDYLSWEGVKSSPGGLITSDRVSSHTTCPNEASFCHFTPNKNHSRGPACVFTLPLTDICFLFSIPHCLSTFSLSFSTQIPGSSISFLQRGVWQKQRRIQELALLETYKLNLLARYAIEGSTFILQICIDISLRK